jgi:anaerobic selenocysteine-containing dehydrogenase
VSLLDDLHATAQANLARLLPGAALTNYAPPERWDDWVELDAKAWAHGERKQRRFRLIPTTCFNCEACCGLLAYVDKDTGKIAKFEGNPTHPASRGRNCAKGPATISQVYDPERILYPLKRAGKRGEGRWQRVTWEEALSEIGGRIGTAFREGRHDEVIYHVGRPGDDSYIERVLNAWGIDGHDSHTNICSSSARVGYAVWMGFDRPSGDHANAKVIFLISSHLEAGHYFNPHAQRIIEGKMRGGKVICVDPRLSNTASMSDHWLAPWPGTEAAMLLAIARLLLQKGTWDREFVRRWVNWERFLGQCFPDRPVDFDEVGPALIDFYAEFTPEFASQQTGIAADKIREIADVVATAVPGRLSSHNWRAAAAGNEGGWQVARCLWFLNVLTGSVGTEGGVSPNGWNKFIPVPPKVAHPHKRWNDLTWPVEYPLAHHEASILLPHFLKEGRGKVDTYFSRVYNPVWTNPDGFSWLEVLTDESLVGCHVALTPTWSETAWFADYVLPMGVGAERHDLASYETHSGRWVGFRQPVFRVNAEKEGRPVNRTWEANPGEVWEEQEFWIDLSWKIDPTGDLGIRKHFESVKQPGEILGIDEYYEMMFDTQVPGLPEAAAKEGLTPLQFMRRYGSFEIPGNQYAVHERVVTDAEIAKAGGVKDGSGVVRVPGTAGSHGELEDIAGHMPFIGDGSLGVEIDGTVRFGFPTPSRKLEMYTDMLVDWGWPEYAMPGYIRSHVHWEDLNLHAGERILVPTFRLPTMIHTRSAQAKWLAEISHAHPMWIHPADAEQLGIELGGLVRVTTQIGHFVIRAWRTEGIRPGVVGVSHHMGRWRLADDQGTPRYASGLATIAGGDAAYGPGAVAHGTANRWSMRQVAGVGVFDSEDPDSGRVWWTDAGVHQNLTFPVQPDPISGMHCWLQRVTVAKAQPGDQYGDVVVDTDKSTEAYQQWLAKTRPGPGPGGLRRPLHLARPVKPEAVAYRTPPKPWPTSPKP